MQFVDAVWMTLLIMYNYHFKSKIIILLGRLGSFVIHHFRIWDAGKKVKCLQLSYFWSFRYSGLQGHMLILPDWNGFLLLRCLTANQSYFERTVFLRQVQFGLWTNAGETDGSCQCIELAGDQGFLYPFLILVRSADKTSLTEFRHQMRSGDLLAYLSLNYPSHGIVFCI